MLEIIVFRNVNLLYFIIVFIIGLLGLAVILYKKHKLVAKLFIIGAIINTCIECLALLTYHRIYNCELALKPFIVLALSIGEIGIGIAVVFIIGSLIFNRTTLKVIKNGLTNIHRR